MRLPDMIERQSDGGPSVKPRPESGVLPRTLTRWVIPFALGGTLLMFSAAGCGGGDSSSPVPTPTPTPTPAPPFTARFVIDWAARSRAISGLSSAQSATFTLFAANPDKTNLVFTVNRPAGAAATSQSYATPSPIRREWGGVLSVDFYSQADGAGVKMGTAVGNGNVPLTSQDGTVPTFALGPDTAVATVTVLPNSLPLGASTQLQYTAKDSAGVILALTPGSAFFTLANPADSNVITLTPDGIATPKEAAPAALTSVGVIATVDGKASTTLSIPLISNGTVSLTPTTADNPVVSYELQRQFTGVTNGLPAGIGTDVNYRVGNAAGVPDVSGNSGSITSTGLYTAPRFDGTFSVIATSKYDSTKSATTILRVESLVAVGITPTNAGDATALDVVINNTVALQSAVTNVPAGRDASVTWAIVDAAGNKVTDDSAGTITPDGVYKAPATRGTYYVQAISRYDTNKKSVIKINALAGTVPITVN